MNYAMKTSELRAQCLRGRRVSESRWTRGNVRGFDNNRVGARPRLDPAVPLQKN